MRQASLLNFLQPIGLKDEKVDQDLSNDSHVEYREEVSMQPSIAEASLLHHLMPRDAKVTREEFFIPTQCPSTIICKVQSHHLAPIKQLTSTLFPVRYPDKFFDECVHDTSLADIARVVLQKSKPIGWIRCRLEPREDGSNNLYIQVIGILAPWRGFGLAAGLLDQVTKPEIILRHRVIQIYAHVWQSNEDALEWYQKRSFTKARLEPNYYRRLRPAGAWILEKDVRFS